MRIKSLLLLGCTLLMLLTPLPARSAPPPPDVALAGEPQGPPLPGAAPGPAVEPAASPAEPSAPRAPEDMIWRTERVDAPKSFANMTDRSLALDASNHPHIAYGLDHLYYAYHDGSSWHLETVDEAWGVGGYAAIALDGAGNPHISYYDATKGNLKYAHYDGTGLGLHQGWQIETVDSAGDVGQYTSIALDGSDLAHISYYGVSNGDLKYAHDDGTDWQITTVDSSGLVGLYTSLALDTNGWPHISYYGAGDLKYAWYDGALWHVEIADSSGTTGTYSSLALDSANLPHISYLLGFPAYDLRYAHFDGSTWISTTVDSAGNVGFYTSIALDAAGQPHISYYHDIYLDSDLKYAYYDGSWQTEVVLGTGQTGLWTSLSLDTLGQPHISFYDIGNGTLQWTYDNGSAWQFSTVDATQSVGTWTSLALDGDSLGRISYYNATNADLKYARRGGSGWNTQTVASTSDIGQYTSLALDASGYPHISYLDDTNDDLRYAYFNGTSWQFQNVDSTGNVGSYTSLALNAGGLGRISYYDAGNGDLKYASYNGTTWQPVTVDSTGSVGQYTSLALDATGNPHISYYDVTNTALKYTYYSGTLWYSETVASANTVGQYTSLALDGAGHPHISYYDATNGDLMYAYHDGTIWQFTNVDATGDVGKYSSIALDTAGRPHIGYYDDTNDDLKYARYDGATWQVETADSQASVGQYTSLVLAADDLPHISYYDATYADLKYTRKCEPAHHLDFTWEPTVPSAWQPVTLTATVQGPGPITLTWDLGDGSTASNLTLTHIYTTSGDYAVTLAAENECGSDRITQTITVLPCDPVHDVDFTWLPVSPTVGDNVSFQATASGALPIYYTWDFGDGFGGSGPNVDHIFTLSDTYTIVLTATNCNATEIQVVSHTLNIPGQLTTTRHVSPNGVDDPFSECDSVVDACKTIQFTLGKADWNDEIRVATSLYTETIGTVAYITKWVQLRGGWNLNFTVRDPAIYPTILDGQGLATTVEIAGAVQPTLDGFYIHGGSGATGGGISGNLAGLILRSCVISDNAAASGGGVGLLDATFPVVVQDSQILSNTATANGGGIYLDWTGPAAEVRVEDNLIQDNQANGDGGGLRVDGQNLTLSSNQILGNTAGGDGGGALLAGSTLGIEANILENNAAGGAGGGLHLTGNSAQLAGNAIQGNTAAGDGGGAYLSAANSTLEENTLVGNHGLRGGGLFLSGTTTTLSENLFEQNTADDAGGAGFMNNCAGGTASHNTVSANQAVNTGGGYSLNNSPLLLDSNTFSGNSAGTGGAVTLLGTSDFTLTNNFFFNNNHGVRVSGALYGVLVNNSFVGGPTAAQGQGVRAESSQIRLTNNILANHASAIFGATGSTVIARTNVFWGNTQNIGGSGVSNLTPIYGDPHFVNISGGDLHLGGGSAAKDAGYSGGTPPFPPDYDIDDEPRPGDPTLVDVGADERTFFEALAATNDSPTILGNPTTLTATPAISNGVLLNWGCSWDLGDGASAQGFVVTHAYPAVGIYTAVATATSYRGIITATTQVVVEETISGLQASSDSPTALGSPTTLTATVAAGTDVSYLWDFGDGELGSGQVVTHVYPATGTYSAVVTASNQVSQDTAATPVTVEDTVAGLNATNDSPTLVNTPTSFTATITAGTDVSYLWDFGDGFTATGALVSHGYTVPGDYPAVVTAYNQVSALSYTTTAVVEEAISGLVAYNNSPTQVAQPTFFSATISAGTNPSYVWNFGDGKSLGYGITTSHTYTAGGFYTATVTATNQVSMLTATTIVEIREPIVGLSACNDSPTALGSPTTLTASVIYGQNVTYFWDLGENGAYTTGQVVNYIYSSTGIFTATVLATNDISSDTVYTIVTVEAAVTGLSAVNDGPTSLGQETHFTAITATGTAVAFTWDFGDGSQPAYGVTATHTYAEIGIYTATVTCVNQVSQDTAATVVVVEEDIAGLSAGNDSPTALGSPTTLIANITAGTDPAYLWDFGDGNTDTGAIVNYTYPSEGTWVASVTAYNQVSQQTAQTTVTVETAISGLNAANDSPSATGTPTTFTATIMEGTDPVYLWSFGDGFTGTGSPVTHIYAAASRYTATVTAYNQVSQDSADTPVTVEDAVAGLTASNDGPAVANEIIHLSASTTAGTGVTFVWNVAGEIKTGANVTATFTTTGIYSALVTASNQVNALTATTAITIEEAISGLIASNDGPVFENHAVCLSASVTSGTNVEYEWTFGDGQPQGYGVQVSHVYTTPGTYRATVIASNAVSTKVAETLVHVWPSPIFLPVIYKGVWYGPWEQEDNDSFGQANGPAELCDPSGACPEYLAYPNDNEDWFYFYAGTNPLIAIEMFNYVGEGGQLLLYDASLGLVALDNDPSGGWRIVESLTPGARYYVRVYTAGGFSSIQPYTLRVSQIEP